MHGLGKGIQSKTPLFQPPNNERPGAKRELQKHLASLLHRISERFVEYFIV